MQKNVRFAVGDVKIIDADSYPVDEFAIARFDFLGSNPNSHKLAISNEVLKECASSVLGKFVVADVDPLTGDCKTHTPNETITGYFPKEQDVVFTETTDGYLRACADAVISKVYAPEFCQIFEFGDKRDVSVEMMVDTVDGKDMDDEVLNFNITGVTVLGRGIRPSSPSSDMIFTRFSEEKASAYFEKKKYGSTLKNFAEQRRNFMEEKYVNHPIDTSKEAIYDGEWDGDQAKHDLIKEENYKTLAPKVCLRLEEGWENREVSKLGYPVMCLHEGKWVYSRKGLASALGYAKQHGDDDIVSKVESIYKKLDLESDGKEESAKMSEKEIDFAAVNIGDMWEKLYDALHDKYPAGEYGSIYWIESIWEEDNQKYAIIRRRDESDLWRLDFSLTEEGLTLADEIVKVEVEIVETDNIRRFAEPTDIEKYREAECEDVCESCGKPMSECSCEDKDADMSAEQMLARISQLEKDIEDRDNIIMEKDAELEDLREFKAQRLAQDKAAIVASVLNSMEDYMDKAELESCRAEGMACEFAAIESWSNKVKASVVDKVCKKTKKDVEFTRIAGGFSDTNNTQSANVWDRIKLD